MLNAAFTAWLKKKHIILEVNNLTEMMASNVGIFFFCHVRHTLTHIQELHLKYLLGRSDAPEMRIKSWKWAQTLLIQTHSDTVDQLKAQFEEASDKFPHESVSWTDRSTLIPPKKTTLIEAHNEHLIDY
jgi:hypothetical protein